MTSGIARIAAVMLLPGCSIVFTKMPPSNQETLPMLECNPRYEAPIIDGFGMLYFIAIAIIASSEQADPEVPNRLVSLSALAFAAASAVGMGIGYRRVKACREARRLAYQRWSIDKQLEPRPVELPGPNPGIPLESQNLIPTDKVTGQLMGGDTDVFVRVSAARFEDRGLSLGAIYSADKGADGACDPTKARRQVDGRSRPPRSISSATYLRGLIKPNTEADLAAFARLNLTIAETIGLVELRKTSHTFAADVDFEFRLRRLAADTGKCLYYISRVSGSLLTLVTFSTETARAGTGIWGVKVYDNYYASDGSVQLSHSLLLELMRFELGSAGIVTRHLSSAEARAFEANFGEATQ